MNRRTFLKATATTSALLATPGRWSAEPAKQTPDDEILAEAKDRIARHRQGNGVVVAHLRPKPFPSAF